MEIDVARAIEEVLDQRKAVNIQGLGSLMLEDIPAKISKNGKKMSPPSAQLKFYEAQTKNSPLRKQLSKDYDLTKEQAQKVIKKFSQSTVNSLLNYGEVNIDGVAKIKKTKKSYTVKAIPSFIDKYYAGLPILALPALMKDLDTSQKKIVKSPTTATPKAAAAVPTPSPTPATASAETVVTSPKPALVKASTTTPIKISDLSSSKPAILGSQAPNTPAPIKQSKPIKTTSTPKPPTPASPTISSKPTPKEPPKVIPSHSKPIPSKAKPIAVNLNDKFSKGVENAGKLTSSAKSTVSQPSTSIKESFKLDGPTTKPTYTPPPPPKDEGIGCMGPLLALLGLAVILFICYKLYGKLMKSRNLPRADKTEIKSEIAKKNSDVASTNDSKSSTSKNSDASKSSGTSNSPESCIIITGVFSSYKNVNKMEDMLSQRGYEVYQEEYGPYTRVGLEFDCADEDLVDYLQNIRATLPNARKAWYLEPEMYVEY